jgi:hypothetical protein
VADEGRARIKIGEAIIWAACGAVAVAAGVYFLFGFQ